MTFLEFNVWYQNISYSKVLEDAGRSRATTLSLGGLPLPSTLVCQKPKCCVIKIGKKKIS